jgi:hypothetical protein
MSRLIILLVFVIYCFEAGGTTPQCLKIVNRLDPKYVRKFITACMVKKMKVCTTNKCQKDAALDCMELTYRFQLKTFQKARKSFCFENVQ